MRLLLRAMASAAAFLALAGPALAAGCHKEPTFDTWLDGVRAEAKTQGDSQHAIDEALDGVVFDPAIVKPPVGAAVSITSVFGAVPTAETLP